MVRLIQKFKKGKDKIDDFYKQFSYLKKPFFILCIIYGISILSIIRANFYYVDDLGRAAKGYQYWEPFSRFLSNHLSTFIHTSQYLTDISPLTQIISVIILSISSCIVLHIFCENKKITIWNILSVLPIGLSPYFLECMSYKFDSPYMALSILAMVTPFVFLKSKWIYYSVSSFLGVLIMCMTYQASSGVYPIIVIFIALLWWNNKESIKKIIVFIANSAASYIIGMLFFKLFIMKPVDPALEYVNNTIFPLNQMISGTVSNLVKYYEYVLNDFRKPWLLLIGIITISFVVLITIKSKRNKIVAFILAIIVVLVTGTLSFGLYIFLEKTIFYPRAMYGFGILIALLMVQCCNLEKRGIIKFACVFLSWCFISFSFTYGNALCEQKRYTDFRIEMVISDLDDLDVMNTESTKKLELVGDIGYSPVLRKMSSSYKMINRLVPQTFGGEWIWAEEYFRNYFDLKNITEGENINNEDLPVLKDSMYHTIKGNEEYIVIELK